MLELLVVIAVIGILVALLLPAIQYAREAARRTQCKNNLRQMGVAVLNFEATHRFYPSNGWGFAWLGDPDRGVGPKQPGGWIYHILPYIDEMPLASLGKGDQDSDKAEALGKLATTPISIFKCPTRPSDPVSRLSPDLYYRNGSVPDHVAKTDYAVNEGDYITDTLDGPSSLEDGDDRNHPWTDCTLANGISYLRSEVRQAHVTDGTSQTILAGEKYVSTTGYADGSDWGYDGPLYSGVDLDLNRWTIRTPVADREREDTRRFGSAHHSACHFVFCDGSVRELSYSIDGKAYRNMGVRNDGATP